MSKLGITEVVLRDAHQSLFATRLRLEDILPIAPKLDEVGYWSMESWGGATFDACIRYLGEDPWERLRAIKKVMPNTRQQMLLRGQNLLGYRHYADDVVTAFVEKAADNGIDVFRIFDAMNDMRNLETAVKAAVAVDKHAQGTISYTTSPVHTIDGFVEMGQRIEQMGCHSICIKDMAGLLKPYVAEELVNKLKDKVNIPLALHCHATTGLSVGSLIKAAEADIDVVDTAISSMSMTYGHSPTEAIVCTFKDTDRDTGLNIEKLDEIAAYFREVRKKYAQFEGELRGTDSRILVAQVPGGMLTNMESQLKEQGASDKMDDVLKEIPRVREDLGYIPLVTPTSQIVGTQSVINVLTGERYKTITKETAGVLRGEYGAAPAPVNLELQNRVLEDGGEVITCRPADLLDNELNALTEELVDIANKENIVLTDEVVEDVLIYAQFPQIGLKFLENRNNPDAFEPVPTGLPEPVALNEPRGPEQYHVSVNGVGYDVVVGPAGEIQSSTVSSSAPAPTVSAPAPVGTGEDVPAPLAGNIFKMNVAVGQQVEAGQVVLIMEAMKMETEVRSPASGTIASVLVKEGDAVQVGDTLFSLS